MVLCSNAFAIQNISTEDVYLQLPGVYVLHPGEVIDLLEAGVPLNTIATSEIVFIQMSRQRLKQVAIPDKNNLSIPTLERTLTETGAQYTQYETEQLIRGCEGSGNLGPFDPLGGGTNGGLEKVSALIGNGIATRYRVTHDLDTDEVMVQTYSNTAPKDTVFPLVDRINNTQIELAFNEPPSNEQYTVLIVG